MKSLLSLLIILTVLVFPSTVSADQKWFYPMTKIDQRATVKGFGMYIDDSFYKSHSAQEFPNHFYGYHAAQDLETFPSEKGNDKNVPVYFVTSGTISYIGSLEGYGGVVLLKLDGTTDTALYGHVRISGIKYAVGQHVSVSSPTVLTYLGNGFSSETSGERKHLHFGIYRGQDLYFIGHEPTKATLNARWYEPLDYLNSKGAESLDPKASPIPSLVPAQTSSENKGFVVSLIAKVLRFVRNIKL